MITTIKARFNVKHKVQFFIWLYRAEDELFFSQVMRIGKETWQVYEAMFNINVNLYNEPGDNILR